MKVKTKFDVGDTVYFLSAEPDYIDQNNSDHHLKIGEVFVIKGKVGNIHITGKSENKYDVEYRVCIRALGGVNEIGVHESMCASDIVQLGVNVSNCYYVSEKNQETLCQNNNSKNI